MKMFEVITHKNGVLRLPYIFPLHDVIVVVEILVGILSHDISSVKTREILAFAGGCSISVLAMPLM